MGSQSIEWKGRAATRLSNGVVELTVLTGGGHLADFRFLAENGVESPNVLWEAPWVTLDPTNARLPELVRSYGPTEIGRFLAGYTGHTLCLDYFGLPTVEEAAAGLSLHGEAAVRNWDVMRFTNAAETSCRWNVRLPAAQLIFNREICLGNRESVAYIVESVHNQRSVDHACHWVQHATFGPPFLNAAECSVIASAQHGMTSQFGYEDCSLLAKNREFSWPCAPREDCEASAADLRSPFSVEGRGFLAGLQMDPRRQMQYIVAVNWKSGLCVGYCFRQQDFPWMAIWEENCTRQNTPWNGRTQARGMEFGTTPLPPDPSQIFPGEKLFDVPTWCTIPANGKREARYLMFLTRIPTDMNSIEDVELEDDAVRFYDARGNVLLSIPAHGCEEFLSSGNRLKERR